MNNQERENNKFSDQQPLRHRLAEVAKDKDKVKINKQLYQIIANKNGGFDVDLLKRKYDPYLDQYDYLVGDVSSEHLRLKGFYSNNARTAIDKKEETIIDYLTEYCNPGTAYFVLKLVEPQHHHYARKRNSKKSKHSNKNKKYHQFKERKVHETKIRKKNSVAVKKGGFKHHSFVIKKRKD